MRLFTPPQRGSIKTDPVRSRRKSLLAGIAAIVVAGGLGLVWLSRPAPLAIKLQELTRPELVLQEERLYPVGQSQPYTGYLVEYYHNSSLKSRSMISNGLLQGVSEGWHTNGQLAVREHFQAGVSHGWRMKWYASGAKMSEVEIVEGKLQGTFRHWHENGTLSEQIEMQHGLADGLSRAYYPSGYLKAQATLHRGELAEQQFWKDGEHKE
jgi:antitoxin component YwqK of YwqJK toxin-antitoxin module